MSWREPRTPNAPTLAHLVDEELHLVVACHGCQREIRLTPGEAVALLGPDCTMLDARDRLRCSWCGAGGRNRISARPCSQDISAKRHLEAARHQRMVWPQDPSTALGLAEAEAAWDARRPGDSAARALAGYRLTTPISEIAWDLRALGLPLIFPNGAMPNDWPSAQADALGQIVPVLRPCDPLAPAAGLTLANLRWGLIPFFHRGSIAAWTLESATARADTVARSRLFKASYERRRCLVPADRRWDLAAAPADPGAIAQDGGWVSFAGLWDCAVTPDGRVESFAIVTQTQGGGLEAVRTDRPLVLRGAQMATWLDLTTEVTGLVRDSDRRTDVSRDVED